MGFIGLALGGGLGRLQGFHGLVGDNLLFARIVLASGNIITVSKDENPDLFWALNGAGHNFGLVVEAVFQVHELIPDMYNANKVYSGAVLEQVVETMNRINPPPKEISIYLAFAWFPDANQVVVFLDFAYMGSATKGKEICESLFGHIPSLSQWDAVRTWNNFNAEAAGGLSSALCEHGGYKNSYGAWLASYNTKEIRTMYDEFVDFLAKYPKLQRSAFAFESYPQEAVRNVPSESTANPNRAANIQVLFMLWYDEPELHQVASEFGIHIRDSLHKCSGFEDGKRRSYVNYGHGDEGFEEFYGPEEWRLQRLKELKRKYDPSHVFSAYHPIPSA